MRSPRPGVLVGLLIVPLVLCVLALAPSIAEAASRVAGDFNVDGFDDLAVGVPFEDVGSVENAGAVNVIYGSQNRLTADGNQLWHQDSAGIADAAEEFDQLGSSLTAGDFQGDGFDDLAVGAPSEDVGSVGGAGAVNAIYGSANRLTATGNQLWHQDSNGIADAAEQGDGLGSSLTAGDFNGTGHDDLGVGVPFEDVVVVRFGGSASVESAGAVNVIYGSGRSALRARGNQLWHQDSPGSGDEAEGIKDAAEAIDRFGLSLPT